MLLAGLLAALSFPNPVGTSLQWSGGSLAFFCLIPLFSLDPRMTFSQAWKSGFVFGMVYFGSSTIWMAFMPAMHPLGPLAWLTLSAYLAVYTGVFLWGYRRLLAAGVPGWSAAVTLWLGLEYVRNFMISGFPWVMLGMAHYQNPWMLALAPVTGVWGASAATVLVNYGLYAVLRRIWPGIFQSPVAGETRPNRLRLAGLAALILFVTLLAIASDRQLKKHPGSTPLVAAALQGNIDQNQVWDQSYQRRTLKKFGRLTAQAAAQGARLTVWPETAFPGIFSLDREPAQVVREWSGRWRLTQLVGTDEVEPDAAEGYLYYNSVVALDESGRVSGATSKKHLVPFGEYVPFKDSVFSLIHKVVRRYGGAGFTPARKRDLLPWITSGERHWVAALICFESLFPAYAAQLTRRGAEILVVVTNDAWFGHSAAPALHASFSAFRAAENGRFLVRTASTGISAIYDPRGRLLSILPLGQSGTVVANVRPRQTLTWFARWGDWLCGIVGFMLLWDLLFIGVRAINNKRRAGKGSRSS
ncbi:MAG: apolipoprotein N-acyltransferase [candidate division FCPU426 bacterium]